MLILNKNGAVEGVSKDGLLDTPYYLTPNRPNTSITLAANGVSPILAIGINGDGPVTVDRIAGQSTGAFLIQLCIYDGSRRVNLTGSAMHSAAIVGSGIKPYRLPESLFVDDLSRIEAVITDLSGSQNIIRPCFIGAQSNRVVNDPSGRLRAGREVFGGARLSYPFIYGPDGGKITLSASGSTEVPITVDTNFDFFLKQISGTSTSTYTIDVLDGNTGESLFNSPGDNHFQVPNTMVVGTANYPFYLERGRLYRRGQKIVLKLTDTSAAINDVYLAFGGRNIANQLARI